MSSLNRQIVLLALIRLLRGVENLLDRLGWDRAYKPPFSAEPIYKEGKSPQELAQYQKNQGSTNDCAAYSVAAALNLIRDKHGIGSRVSYREAVETADRHPVFGPSPLEGVVDYFTGESFRLWPGGPITPRQQTALAERLAARHGLLVRADSMRATTDDLITLLRQPDMHILVTLGWGDLHRPRILHPDGKFHEFGRPQEFKLGPLALRFPFNAHVMLLAAYDPSHTAKDGRREVDAPWGFINSWVDAGDHLYWMTEEDFRAAWRYVIPGVGRQKMVVIQRAL